MTHNVLCRDTMKIYRCLSWVKAWPRLQLLIPWRHFKDGGMLHLSLSYARNMSKMMHLDPISIWSWIWKRNLDSIESKKISKYDWLDLTRLIFFSRGSAFFLTLHGINSNFYPTSRYLNEFFICKNNLKVTFYILMNIILILLSTKGDARASLFMGSFIIQKYFHVGFRVCWSPMITAYYLTKAKGTTMWSTMHKSRGC